MSAVYNGVAVPNHLNAAERLAGGYGIECGRVRQDPAIAESQVRDYQARLGKPFLYATYLSELTGLRDELKAGLSATAELQADPAKPTVSQLVEWIKAFKSAHSIEASPQRERQKHSTAEEPITARIRRRAEAILAADQASHRNSTEQRTSADSPEFTPESVDERMTFQQYLAMQRTKGGSSDIHNSSASSNSVVSKSND